MARRRHEAGNTDAEKSTGKTNLGRMERELGGSHARQDRRMQASSLGVWQHASRRDNNESC